MKRFGDIIRQQRIRKQWTLKILHENMKLKASSAYLSCLENDNEVPSVEMIVLLADTLELDREELLEIAKQQKIKQYSALMDKKFKKGKHE